MANLPVRQNGGALARRAEWDPVNWARDLLRWDPFREMAPSSSFDLNAFMPAFDVKETKEGYLFHADLPGVAEKDIEVTRTGNRLTISGKRETDREDKSDTCYSSERTFGAFTRAFTLPDGIDGEHIRAELKDGVLTVMVPKTPAAQPQKIAIKPIERKS